MTYLCRWPNGDFTIVGARTSFEALRKLEDGGEEPRRVCVWKLDDCILRFSLTDDGDFEFESVGEKTGEEILSKAFPRLHEALSHGSHEEVVEAASFEKSHQVPIQAPYEGQVEPVIVVRD